MTYLCGKEIIAHESLTFHIYVTTEYVFWEYLTEEKYYDFYSKHYNMNDNLSMTTISGIEKGFGAIEFLSEFVDWTAIIIS